MAVLSNSTINRFALFNAGTNRRLCCRTFSCVSAVLCLTRARASASLVLCIKTNERSHYVHTYLLSLALIRSPMSCPSNALTVGSHRMDASAPPGNTTGTAIRQPPDILTYSHDSRMVYVTPGETYDVCSFLASLTPNLPLLIE